MPLPTRNSALDRLVDFVPNRVLKAQELELLASISEARDSYGIGSVYRDGGTLNVKVVITANSVSIEPMAGMLPISCAYAIGSRRCRPIFDFTGQNTPKPI